MSPLVRRGWPFEACAHGVPAGLTRVHPLEAAFMVLPGGRVYKIPAKQADISQLFVLFLNLFLIQVWSNYNVVLTTAIQK